MRTYIILLLTLLVYGCDQSTSNNTANIIKQEVTSVSQYPKSKLIESSHTNEYKKYVYHTADEFGEILNFYEDTYGTPIDSNYSEHEIIKHTYESMGIKISVKMSYLPDEITKIEIKKYH